MSKKYKYPCTRHIEMNGFGKFIEEESKGSRYNLNKFSEELKDYFNIPYITLVNSGSSANLVAALAMAEKVKKANKPLVAAISAFTFPTTISALVLAGFKLITVDVTKDYFNMDIDKLKNIDSVPSVIVLTHFLGFPCNIEEFRKYANDNNCFILQDACETLGMQINNKQIFEYGDITTWSFYHPHHLSAYGGGVVITLTKDDYILTDSIAHWGRACKCHIDESLCILPEGPAHQFTYERIGVNVEMSELNACFGRWQFLNWNGIEEKRIKHYDILYNTLKDVKTLKIWESPKIESSAFVFPIKLLNGMTVNDAYNILSKEDIEIRILMGGVSNEQEAFKDILDNSILKNAHEMAETTFFVGIHQTLSDEDVEYVANKIKELFS